MAKSAATKKSKFFRVAVEGATTDGREITREQIQQMAKNFDPETYGARIWLEHIRGTTGDSTFGAYGDVLAVKTDDVEINGKKKLALMAQISPTPELIELNKKRQKIYTSIELAPQFSDTKQAYLVGLGVTDSPASLGTEMLTFASQSKVNPFSTKKQNPDNLFTEAVEVVLEFDDDDDTSESTFSASIKKVLKKFSKKSAGDDERFEELLEAVESIADHSGELEEKHSASNKKVKKLEAELETFKTEFSAFKEQMDKTDHSASNRPTATGGNGNVLTNY